MYIKFYSFYYYGIIICVTISFIIYVKNTFKKSITADGIN